MLISVYTDGSCHTGENTGSYGYVIIAKHNGKNVMRKYSSGKYQDTTNNRMELKAIIKCLENIDPGHNIDIYSDSQYCVKGANEWLRTWVKKGTLKDKQNTNLWKRFIEVRDAHKLGKTVINLTWVRGHNNNKFNEMADKLANVGRLKPGVGVSCKKNN